MECTEPSTTEQKQKEQQQQKQFVIIKVNENIPPEDPKKLGKSTEEYSLKCRGENIQAWKSEFPENLTKQFYGNGLVNAVYMAYYKHYNLELSPDDIWLAILQGFSNHLELNHEQLRKQFVNFDGKKQLNISRDQFVWGSNENDWAGCFEEWCWQISENIGQQNYENLMPKFTTETQVSKACFNATLMDSMKHYFSFGCISLCGIPQVKLTGSLEDWQVLRKRAQNLGQYDLEWWTCKLLPILDKFIEAYKGEVDQVFWNCIYKTVSIKRGSGGATTVSGWILNFFPYIKGDYDKEKNYCLKTLEEIYENYRQIEKNQARGYLEDDNIFGGMTKTPFTWNYQGKQIDMQIIAGFHNVCQDGEFIKPAKGWAIAKK